MIFKTITPYSIARLPHIEFGSGKADLLDNTIATFGSRFLLVTGSGAIEQTAFWDRFNTACKKRNLEYTRIRVTQEPSPDLIDNIVNEQGDRKHDCVVGLGGGSVLDAAKAIAGLLPNGRSVMDHLEGVGPELPYEGPPLPFIAVPTTAGTGSEATKNAVLSVQGRDGFKKSFRDEQLVADIALVDPELLASCPQSLIAANGMDALTQLMESYVSTNANPLTDALALDGLQAANRSLLNWYENRGDQVMARTDMAYASMLSGITLAQAGLGSVHGLASPLGAFFPIPHGVVCGTLVAKATEINIQVLQNRDPDNIAMSKYAELGRLFANNANLGDEEARKELVRILDNWTERMNLPRLSDYNITPGDHAYIVAHCRGSSMKTNPIVLSDEEVHSILAARQ